MKFNNRDDIIQLTPLWQGERFDDGRPRVPDDILHRMERITNEEAWAVLERHGYRYQFEGNLRMVHPNKVLVGRAVTAVMVPKRPDLHDYLLEYGQKEEGRKGFFNVWVIDTLVEDDVIVVDMFDKVVEGTFSGGNLSTTIATRTKRGQVIYGGIRDLQQILEIENLQTYYRGIDPTPIRDVTLIGMNVPCRIGGAICMPGDVVLGTPAGVTFIPPHLAEEICISAEKTRLRDMFGFVRIREGKYSSSDIDVAEWAPEIEEDFRRWRENNTPDDLKHLVWDEKPSV
ncbi:ribonuclease activity regulator RraA [Alicyclobacillus hesperidum subsp. aegles]|uniref:RraA family protein n=1 Tax=Alicyclobacillus hesperidum TaxID=89784 RepID=UPI00222D9041|nr:RraA family protein [Alicyclobacillus hesperidum]GLG02682.1 ribonuclease activity regulator RraA [Alicyclobacillus hesperidum subsp. aegles]